MFRIKGTVVKVDGLFITIARLLDKTLVEVYVCCKNVPELDTVVDLEVLSFYSDKVWDVEGV